MGVKQTGVVTYSTLVGFKADTLISQQVGDVVQIENVLKPGITHIARNAGAETPDDSYTIRKTNDSGKTFWASSVSALKAGNVEVAYSAIPDGAEESIEVPVVGLEDGVSYRFGVISGLPEGTELAINRVKTVGANTFLVLLLKNNSGGALAIPASGDELFINIYE